MPDTSKNNKIHFVGSIIKIGTQDGALSHAILMLFLFKRERVSRASMRRFVVVVVVVVLIKTLPI